MTERIVDILAECGLNITHPFEKVHMAYNLLENLCHDTVYHKHDNIDYMIMRQEVIKTIIFIIKS